MLLVTLEKIKRRLGIDQNDNSKDLDVMDLLEEKNDYVLKFCDKLPKPMPTDFKCPSDLQGAICKMVAVEFNKIGSEGLTSEAYSGTNQTFEADTSEEIKRVLNSYRKVLI